MRPMLFGPSRRTPSAARARDEPRLPRRAFGAGFGEAVGEDGRHRHAARAALLERELHRVARRHDERVVDLARRLGEARVGALAEHLASGSR